MSEEKNISVPVIGKFKPKRKFLSFFVAKQSKIRLIENTAILPLTELTRVYDHEDIKLKFTICEEDTINIEEVDTDFFNDEMLQKFIDDIDSREVVGYAHKYIIRLGFKSEDGSPLYLEVEEDRPVDKLSNLLDEIKAEQNELSDKGLSILDSLFGSEPNEEDSLSEKDEEEEVIAINDSTDDSSINKSFLAASFQKMNEEKIKELQKRIDKNEEEVKKLQFEISSKEKLVTSKIEEFNILKSRLQSLQPKPTPLGIYVFVGEKEKTEIEVDENLIQVVKKISPILNLKESAVIDLLKSTSCKIHFGNEAEDFKLTNDILKTIKSIDLAGSFEVISESQVVYIGDLTWHQILDKLIQNGFEQNPEFDEKSGSNSYKKDE